MNKKEAKEEIGKIVAKYEKLSSREKNEYNEAMTRKDFILPLFHVLGWDVYNDSIANEVKEEESAVKGTVDYSFRINNIPQFLLEAKAMKVDLDKIEWANQAVNYGWNMGIEWVILTDFEGVKLFNASWKIDTPKPNLELTYREYLDRFDDLWLLSKESFENGELNKQAGKWNIGAKRVEVTEKLASDLIEWRKELFDNFHQWNSDKSEEEIDEAVQRILDRFIFMRSCEDKKIESPLLWQNFQRWNQDMKERNFLRILKPVFEEFDENYNSNLFKEHLCDNLETEGTPFLRVISGLYGDKESGVKYNFAAIKPDVLGKVYEQYLGHLLQKAGKRGEDLGKTKRKKQGIYYTPTFIVDYIVQNALGPVLDGCKTIQDLKKIKVLDPACGSGSFLIKALEMINEKYKKFGAPGDTYTKILILTENIYGVDLDEQAVEITRLNLLLNALEKRLKFPLLTNIKNGNSLISGTNEELVKYFGRNLEDRKSFNWKEQYPEIFKGGGFDVVIGNPPWGAKIEELDKKYYKNLFQSGTGIIDTFALFIEKSLSLLKENGCLGFVLPDIILLKNYPQIRKLVLDNTSILNTYYTGMAFKDVNLDSVVMIFKKERNKLDRDKNVIDVIVNNESKKIDQKLFYENKDYKFNLYFDKQNISLKKKLDSSSIKLGELLEIHEGIHSGNIRDKLFIDSSISNDCQKLLFKGTEVNRYLERWSGKYVNYNKEIIKKDKNEYANLGKREYFINRKILVRRTGDRILATIDENNYFASNNFFVLYKKDKKKQVDLNLKYILAILNSKIGTWYFLTIQPRRGKLFAEIKINHLTEIPVPIINSPTKKEIYANITKLVDKILDLNREIKKIVENSEKWNRLKSEIESADKKIDEEVYKLYSLTLDEIKIVESMGNENNK